MTPDNEILQHMAQALAIHVHEHIGGRPFHCEMEMADGAVYALDFAKKEHHHD